MQKEDILKYLISQKEFFYNYYKITSIGLFGSFARNMQTETSDIDIVYEVAENQKISYFQLFELEELLQKNFNKKIDLVNYKFMNPIIKYKALKDIIYV